MGRDRLSHFNIISLCEVNHVTKPLQDMLDKHSDVFDKDLGCMKGVVVTFEVKSEVKKFFFKPCSVPYILKQKVADELDRLCNLGIISPVKTAKWATPIVPVVKKDGTIRICGDFKSTLIRQHILRHTLCLEWKSCFLIQQEENIFPCQAHTYNFLWRSYPKNT